MDKQEALFILQSSRFEPHETTDARVTEAWQIVHTDSALAARALEDIRVDNDFAIHLQRYPVPLDLPARIMFAGQRRTLGWRRRARVLGLAASIILLLSFAALWFAHNRAAVSFASYRTEMIGRLENRFDLTFHSQRPPDLQQWLESKRGLHDTHLPDGLQALPGIGCRTWMWNGQPAGLICFLLENGEPVHLFVISRGAVPRGPSVESPAYRTVGNWETISWTSGDNLYLLAGRMDRAALEKLL
ncbi:MAG: hypothetical protein QOF48_2291 [Verrucomicrobiota bacterium]|jgi:hypothetical protein